MQLVNKYQPKMISEFLGLQRPKRILNTFEQAPYSSAWLLVGPSGLGKTTMALALSHQIGGQLHHIPSRKCDLATVEKTVFDCHYYPFEGRFHTALVDEADQMTKPAQLAFLSVLDSTAPPPDTIFVFTANDTTKLEDRFLSRCRVVEFTADEIDWEDMLSTIWNQEAMERPAPNWQPIINAARGNVRTAIMALETELMDYEPPKPKPEWLRSTLTLDQVLGGLAAEFATR